MQNIKKNYFQRRTKFEGPRTNHRIRSLDVQVISSNGENLGVLPIKKAIEAAKNEGLDLIEISPKANPPVCKIIIMAVPKRKTSISKKRMRRSHHKLSSVNIIEDKKSGEYRLSHHLDLKTGFYKGRQVLDPKE